MHNNKNPEDSDPGDDSKFFDDADEDVYAKEHPPAQDRGAQPLECVGEMVDNVQGDFRFNMTMIPEHPQEELDQSSMFDENIAQSTFKHGDAALDFIRKQEEERKKADRFRVNSHMLDASDEHSWEREARLHDRSVEQPTTEQSTMQQFHSQQQQPTQQFHQLAPHYAPAVGAFRPFSRSPPRLPPTTTATSAYSVPPSQQKQQEYQSMPVHDQPKAVESSVFKMPAAPALMPGPRANRRIAEDVTTTTATLQPTTTTDQESVKTRMQREGKLRAEREQELMQIQEQERAKLDASREGFRRQNALERESRWMKGNSQDEETIAQVSQLTLKPADAATFILECTKDHQNDRLLEADKRCLYFGFRPLELESVNVLCVTNTTNRSMWVKCHISPSNTPFKILNNADAVHKIRPNVKHAIYISLTPEKAMRMKGSLHIRCFFDQYDRQGPEYKYPILGFGGQASVGPLSVEKREPLVMATNGRFQLIPESLKKFSFCLENLGDRDAFASIIIQDMSGAEIPAENVLVQPSNLLLSKNRKDVKKIDVRMLAQYQAMNRTGSTTALSRAASSMSNASTSMMPVAFRVVILWGEERQRQRLKMLEQHKRDKFSFLRRYFTVGRFYGEAETPTGNERAIDEMLSVEDYTMFKYYLRVTTIEVLDGRHRRMRPASTMDNRFVTGGGSSVMSIDPDTTLTKMDEMMPALTDLSSSQHF